MCKSNCWDNACAESFFHSLKVETIQYVPIMTKKEMRQNIFEYIEVVDRYLKKDKAVTLREDRHLQTEKCKG